MEVKGSSLTSTRDFVMLKFGQDGFDRWLSALSPEAKKIYSAAILATSWYPMKLGLVEPTEQICKIFYNGEMRGAWETGMHSAEIGLRGVYRFFIKMGSPQFILSKAGSILPTYYKPSRMSGTLIEENKGSIKIHEFPEMCGIIEHRIGGWMEKALEVSGRKSVAVIVARSLLKGHEYTEYQVEWA